MNRGFRYFLWPAAVLVAGEPGPFARASFGGPEVARLLDSPVEDFSVRGQDARSVFEGIGAGYRFPIVIEPEIQGTVTLELHHAVLRTLLEALCQAKGWSFESAGSYLLIRRFVTRIYPVDYLQLAQTGSSSASVNLSAGGSQASAANTVGTAPSGAASAGTTVATAQTPAASGGGSSTLALSLQNEADFWGRLETDLKGMTGEGESLVVNRFAGLVQLRGSLRTHAVLEAYLRRVVERVGRQARISVKIAEVDLNDQSKLGIDWTLAAGAATRIATATATGGQIGPIPLSADTFSGTLGAGQVQAALSALAEQGRVTIESKPEISALNNQTAVIQVSQDQPFFSRINTTTINAGAAQTVAQPIVATNYAESTVSFGNVLEITVQIADDLTTKLSLSPAVTELQGTVTSPDGQETAPITGTKRIRTTVTLRNHETAVLGGFITETTSTDRRSVPGLGELPLIGNAFSTRVRAKSRVELVFFITVNAVSLTAAAPEDVPPPSSIRGASAARGEILGSAHAAVSRIDLQTL